jgi:endonuclease YncB( thermonuclease family)
MLSRSISRYSHRYFRWQYTDRPEREQAADQNPAGRDRRARARAAFGTKSKQSLSDLCFGKQAKVTPRVKVLYGRTVARISCGGIDANAEQVSRGMAWIYRKYAKDHNFYIFEQEAKRFKRGLSADKSPTPPWDWRKTKRYASTQVMRYG